MMAGFEAEPGDERLSSAMLSYSLDECGLRSQSLRAACDRHRIR